jgi:hypothetical protein
LKLPVNDAEAATRVFTEAANTRWELAALDLLPGGKTICLRLAGPAAALVELSREVLARWPGESPSEAEAETIWSELREFRWAHANGILVKVAITPAVWPALEKNLRPIDGTRVHVSAGGNQAFVSLPSAAQSSTLDEKLRGLSLPSVTLRGDAPLWLGTRAQTKIAMAVKQALDPENRFPTLDD